MIAILIFVIMLISFTTIISYNLLSFNHNLNVANESDIIKKELAYIKQKLIINSKPILEEEEYALPYGVNDLTLNIHKLPENLGFAEKNSQGFYFQYCPYGYVDSTTKSDSVLQGASNSYSVAIENISGVDYVTHSEAEPSPLGAPKAKAFIISKFDNDDAVKCEDIKYNSNNNKFYLNDAKVESITEEEIVYYYKISNLSSQTEVFNVDNSNVENAFDAIKNDVSNKSYYVELTENVSISDDYYFYRKPSKNTSLEINTNGYEIYGNDRMSFENMNVYIQGDDGTTVPSSPVIDVESISGTLTIENLSFGGVRTTHSELNIKDSLIYTSNSQRAIYSYNSKVLVDGLVSIVSNDTNDDLGLVDLNDTKLTINKGSQLYAETENGKSSYILEIKKSDVFISGEFKHISSTQDPIAAIYIGDESVLHLDAGTLNTRGQGGASDLKYEINVKGTLSSGGQGVGTSYINMVSSSGKNGIVNVSNGGKLALDNIKIGDTGSRGVYTIFESSNGTAQNGASMLSGDSSVIIDSGSLGCWMGYSFEDDLMVVSQISSGTVKENNTSNWSCI